MHDVSIINPQTGEYLGSAVVESLNSATITTPVPPCDHLKGEAVHWDGSNWQVKIKDVELFHAYLRAERDIRLAETDWTQVGDSKLSAELQAKVQEYRQALRDVTKQDPNNFAWPVNPLAK